MTDLQLGLVLIGALAVGAVFVYNRIQERGVRREAEKAFGSRHPDVLASEAEERREPAFERSPEPPAIAPAAPTQPPDDAMPDDRIDYVVDLALKKPSAGAAVLELWTPLERRFGKRALLAAFDGRGWRRLVAGDSNPVVTLRAAMQLVTRTGVANETEVIEFRSGVETVAGKLKAAISAPEMREALDSAKELDQACAQADIQVAFHVVGVHDEYEFDEQPFQVARREDGVTFTLDVPRTLDLARSYEAMARAARQFAAASGGRLVDDNGRELDERALAAIELQLEPARRTLVERGIEPGGALALRLFS